MHTVDYIDREWYVMQPNSGGRACARCHYEADARMIADALNEVAQLRAENERLRAALEKIKTARDHHSKEGVYPEKIHIQYQGCFDDWAADLAEYAIAQSGAPARETSRAARAALGKGAA